MNSVCRVHSGSTEVHYNLESGRLEPFLAGPSRAAPQQQADRFRTPIPENHSCCKFLEVWRLVAIVRLLILSPIGRYGVQSVCFMVRLPASLSLPHRRPEEASVSEFFSLIAVVVKVTEATG